MKLKNNMKLKNILEESQDVGKKHQIKIALQTLRSIDVFSNIMGGPDKEESIEILLDNGWTKDKVKNYLKQHSHSDDEISKFDSLNENFDPMVVYNSVKSIAPYVFGIALGSLLVAKSFPNFIERALESTVEGLEAVKFKQKLKQLENDSEIKQLAKEFSSLSGKRSQEVMERRKVIRKLIREKLKTIFGDVQFRTISTAMTDQDIDKKLRNISNLKEGNSQKSKKKLDNTERLNIIFPRWTQYIDSEIRKIGVKLGLDRISVADLTNYVVDEITHCLDLKNSYTAKKDIDNYIKKWIMNNTRDVINNLSESKLQESLDKTEVSYIKKNFGKIVAFADKNDMDIEDAKAKFLIKYKNKSNIKESTSKSDTFGHINESTILKQVIKKCLNEILSSNKELENQLNTLLYTPAEEWENRGIKTKSLSRNSQGFVHSGILSTGEHFYRQYAPENRSKHQHDEFIITNSLKESDPCWKNYKMVGMKNKNGKKVPNCVPINEDELNPINIELIKYQALSLIKDGIRKKMDSVKFPLLGKKLSNSDYKEISDFLEEYGYESELSKEKNYIIMYNPTPHQQYVDRSKKL